MKSAALPAASAFEQSILDAVGERGRPLSIEEIDGEVARRLELPADALCIPHRLDAGKRTEFAYRMAWARTRLKEKGQLIRTAHKTWALPEANAEK